MRASHLLYALLGSLGATLLGCHAEGSDDAATPTDPVVQLVATQRIEPRPYDRTLPRKLGVLEASERRQLAFEVSGRLAEIVEEGTLVRADEVIARLDSTMEAAELRRAELMRSDASSEWDRVQGLSAARAASQKQLDTARMQLDMRDAEVTIAQHRLSQRQLRPGISGVVADVLAEPGELVVPQSAVATVLDTSSLRLVIGVPGYQVAQVSVGSRARVYVPAATPRPLEGTIQRVASAALPGEHLFEVEIRIPNPGAPGAASIAGVRAADAAADAAPARTQTGAVAESDRASRPLDGPGLPSDDAASPLPADSIQSEGGPQVAAPRALDGRPSPPSATGPSDPPQLRPGMNAWAELVAESYESALVLPLEAMVDQGGDRVVFFVVDGRAVPVSVAEARIANEQVILPGGLPYRDLVVRGHHDLEAGEQVEIDNRVLEGRPRT